MCTLPLIFGILVLINPAVSLLKLTQDMQVRESRCKKLIVQHFLTFGKSSIDPIVMRECIIFLRSKDLDYHDKEYRYPTGRVLTEESMKQKEAIKTKLVLKEPTTSNENFEFSNNYIKNDLVPKPIIEESQIKYKDPLSSEESKQIPVKKDDLIDIYPEKILQEWPAVEMVRKKRDKEENNNYVKKNLMRNKSTKPQEIFKDPLSKDLKQIPVKKDDLIDIYPEKILQEWPAVGVSRKKRNTEKDNYIENNLLRTKSAALQENDNNLLSKEDFKPIPVKKDDLIDIYPEKILQEWPAVGVSRKKRNTEKDNYIEKNVLSTKSAASQENFKNTKSKEDFKQIPVKKDDLIDIYPEKILQEWPAVGVTRKKRDVEEINYVENKLLRTRSTEPQENLKDPLLKEDFKQIPVKKDDLIDIYPEKILREWPAADMIL